MTTLQKVNQYKKRIHEYIETNPKTHHYGILQNLLEDYLDKYHVANASTSTIFNQKPTSVPLARALAKAVYNNDDDIIDLINTHLKNEPINKNDNFFALLTAYFYYFEDVHTNRELQAREALYQQILVPLHLYRERVEKDAPNYLIAITDYPDEYLRGQAYIALGTIPIPEKQLETLVTALLAKIDDPNGYIRGNANTALGTIPIPEKQQEAVIAKLLTNIPDSTQALLALCEKITPDERMVMVARLEGLQATSANPHELISLQTLIQTYQSKTVTLTSLLQHLPPEKVEEIDKKLR